MNDGIPPERWVFILDIRADGPPAAVTAKRLLKHILRRWGIRCRGFSQDRKLFEQKEEIERLRAIINSLAARVAEKGEAL